MYLYVKRKNSIFEGDSYIKQGQDYLRSAKGKPYYSSKSEIYSNDEMLEYYPSKSEKYSNDEMLELTDPSRNGYNPDLFVYMQKNCSYYSPSNTQSESFIGLGREEPCTLNRGPKTTSNNTNFTEDNDLTTSRDITVKLLVLKQGKSKFNV